ncbi:MAG: TonB-dependent hemoglobin/transferrin/lactoferrin family receptor [[Pasteurella] mairii]|uniref:TonB-dependent heme receptor A n=1 Tax=[Pasteurella] mairii TaxID=757 RepID=A0A379B1R6_9PAST|nr:TonB-dependent hemoglobin/transferrin/lactoferrin family receptor [[Pasteurella] mairii]SUB32563.1 TonB-dependent heme receptor A [[Pasteurella] mairii]
MRLSKIYFALFLSLPAVTFANATALQLDEISVIAGRNPSTWVNYANEKQYVGKSELLTRQVTSTADALKYLPNVDIQGGSRAIAQKPSVRGLSGNRVTQVIDGVKQNFDLEHRGSYFLPPSLMQEIELIKGPSSNIWGSSALGGVVVIRTPNALDLLKENENLGGKIKQGYQSANALSETEASIFMANSRFDALISGFYNQANDLRTGSGNKLIDTGYQQKGGLVKLGWQINDENRLELSHRLSQFEQTAPTNNTVVTEFTENDIITKIKAWHRDNRATPTEMSKFYNSLTTEFGSVSYRAKQKIIDQSSILNYYLNPDDNPYLNMQVTLYRNNTVEQEKRLSNGLKDKTKLISTGINLRNTTDLNWVVLTYGVDFTKDKATTERGKNATTFRPDPYQASAKNTAFYILTDFPLWNEKLIFSPSLRYDHVKTEGQSKEYTEHHWSPAIALTWKATDWLDLSARYTNAFRMPSMQERFISGSHFGANLIGRNINNTFLANPDLGPETAKNKEINAHFYFTNIFSEQDKVSFNATYFQNDVKDFIHLNVFKSSPQVLLPNVSQYQNIANARLRGIELETAYQTERLNILAGYGQTRGKDKNTQEALSNIAADKFSFGINYALVKNKFTVGARVTHYAKQKRVPSNHGISYQGYTLTDLTASYAPLSGEWKNLRLDFAIENAFDKKYLPAFSFMEGNGRNVKLSASYQF